MIKAVLFDLDGTLLDTNKIIIESYKYTIKKHFNRELEEENITKYFGEPLITTLSRYSKENAEELVKTYKAYNESIHDGLVTEMKGAADILMALREAGVKVAVVTSKRRYLAERGMKLCNLLEKVDAIITPEDTVKHKPEGEPVLKACSALEVLPSEALMVGDSHYDIMCGKNAGSKTCVVRYSLLPFEELMKYKPDFIIEDLMDLMQIIGRKLSKD